MLDSCSLSLVERSIGGDDVRDRITKKKSALKHLSNGANEGVFEKIGTLHKRSFAGKRIFGALVDERACNAIGNLYAIAIDRHVEV
jgi:hypothetical protein